MKPRMQKQSHMFNFCNIIDLLTSRTQKTAWWPPVFKSYFYIFPYNEQFRKILRNLIYKFLLYHTSLIIYSFSQILYLIFFYYSNIRNVIIYHLNLWFRILCHFTNSLIRSQKCLLKSYSKDICNRKLKKYVKSICNREKRQKKKNNVNKHTQL